MATSKRVWFITGASSGFGLELARAALGGGDAVVAAARKVSGLKTPVPGTEERFMALPLDVSRSAELTPAVQAALERFGQIDVLVNNAGHTQVGAVEETTDSEMRDLFEVHFFGPFALIRAVLPHMRQRRSGWVIQMSSVGGRLTLPGFGAYCATKYALEGLSSALAAEVAPFGIHVLIVEPGAFRTALFTPGVAYQSKAMPEYAQTVGGTREFVSTGHGQQSGDPAKAAAGILKAIDAPRPPLRLVLGGDAVDGIRAALDVQRQELDIWERLGRDTQFDGPNPGRR